VVRPEVPSVRFHAESLDVTIVHDLGCSAEAYTQDAIRTLDDFLDLQRFGGAVGRAFWMLGVPSTLGGPQNIRILAVNSPCSYDWGFTIPRKIHSLAGVTLGYM
jgi:hypothetical protein